MGKSKYDDLARELLALLDADGVIICVVGGKVGNGACNALRAGAQARPTAAALRIGLLQMAELVVADGEQAAAAGGQPS